MDRKLLSDKSLKVLVADDQPAIRMVLAAILKKKGLEVVQAEDGEEALNQIREHHDISLIMIDLKMPGMDGFEFIEAVRESDLAKGVPIVMITGLTNTETIETAKKLGVDGWIAKPFQHERILDTVFRLLESKPQPSESAS